MLLEPLHHCAVLLHIGAFKTGTTALQHALFNSRENLLKHGVLHAGHGRNPIQAVLALRGSAAVAVGHGQPSEQAGRNLAAQVADAADHRVVVSSEFLSDARPEAASRLVSELGGDRVHVVATVRPLSKILPSQWQQYVTNRMTVPYEEWLDAMLRQPPYKQPTPGFWNRHAIDDLVGRWSELVGPDRVTLMVVDESDRTWVLRRFEELLALPTGLLELDPKASNRSMSFAEAELMRRLGEEALARGWPDEVYRKVVAVGVGRHLRSQDRVVWDDSSIATPQWALDRAAEIGCAAAEKIAASGVRVVGDLSALGARTVGSQVDNARQADALRTADAICEAVVAAVTSSGLLAPAGAPAQTPTSASGVPAGRVWRKARRALVRLGATKAGS